MTSKWPSTGGGSVYWADAVATSASLPSSTVTGEVRQALDTGTLWIWNGAAWLTYIVPALIGAILPIANGGTGSATGFSDLTATVATKLALAGGTMSGYITLHADPSSSMHAVTKQYVDSLSAGFDVKASVVAATTANITLSGAQTIDGIALIAGDRCLVKDQTLSQNNGVYLVAAGAWTRVSDMDSWIEVPGAFAFVERGTTLADTGWVCTADAGGTLGTTSITWSQFSGVGNVTNASVAAGAAIDYNKLAALTISRALVSDGSGVVSVSTVSTTQLQYLAGATGTTGTTSTNLVFSTSPTFAGTVNMPSGSITATAWTMGSASLATTTPTFLSNGGLTLIVQSVGASSNAALYLNQGSGKTSAIGAAGTSDTYITGSVVNDLCIQGAANVLFAGGGVATKLGGYTTAGAWTLGVSGVNNNHTLYSKNTSIASALATEQTLIFFKSASTVNGAIGASGSSGSYISGGSASRLQLIGTSGLDFSGNDGTTLHGSTSSAGAWTLGTTSYPAHTINGNTTITGSSGNQLTLNKTATPASIQFQSAAANIAALGGKTGGGLQFYNASTALMGQFDNSGAWTFGPASGLTTPHIFKSATAANTASVSIESTSGAASLMLNPATVSDWGEFLNGGTTGYRFKSAANAVILSLANGGQLTVGATGVSAGIILNNSTASYSATLLDYYETGTFTTNATGFTTTPTGTIRFLRIGSIVTLYVPDISGTSNAPTFTLDGLPARIRPTRDQIGLIRVQNNSAIVANPGTILFTSASGTMTLDISIASAIWFSSGTKGVYASTITYFML